MAYGVRRAHRNVQERATVPSRGSSTLTEARVRGDPASGLTGAFGRTEQAPDTLGVALAQGAASGSNSRSGTIKGAQP